MARDETTSPQQTLPVNQAHDAARAPRQARGQARVEAILDAAAALVSDSGLASVTMHAVARRARTSIGSMYHFFPDRDSVLRALCQRHAQAISAISQQFNQTPAEYWQKLTAAAAIDHLLKPYAEYLRCHGDYLELIQARTSSSEGSNFVLTIRTVLDARLPCTTPAERQDHATMLHAIAVGTMRVGVESDPGRADMYLREIPRVLSAYLEAIETNAATRH